MGAGISAIRSRWAGGLALLLACLFVGPAASAAPPTKVANAPYPADFQSRVRKAIERGVLFVRTTMVDGLERDVGTLMDDVSYEGAAATIWVLRRAGVPADEPAFARVSKILHRRSPKTVDEASLLLLAICAMPLPEGNPFAIEAATKEAPPAASKEDRAWAEGIVKFVLDRQVPSDGTPRTGTDRAYDGSGGWESGEQKGSSAEIPATYIALLGLEAAARSGITVPPKVWLAALKGLLGWQDPKGPPSSLKRNEVRGTDRLEWTESAHARGYGFFGSSDEQSGYETASGAVGLVVCRDALGADRGFTKELREEARVDLRDALAWIQQHYDIRKNPVAGKPTYAGSAELEGPLYHHHWLQGLARLGVHLRMRHFAGHDWYQEGAEELVKTQALGSYDEGSWGAIWWGNCYSLLFLMRASLASIAPAVTVSEPDPGK